MSVLSFATLAVSAIALTIGVLLVARLLRGERVTPVRAWEVRSSQDRRRRHLPASAERRRGPRRQEDIARRFLSGVGRSTVVRRS